MCLQEEITPEIIANSIYQDSFKGYYILVEGESDNLFYSKFLNDNESQIEICHGKENVIEAISIINERQKKRDVSIAIIDKDYDFLDDSLSYPNNVIQTDFHDIEMMCLNSDSFLDFSKEYFSDKKMNSLIGNGCIRNYLLNIIKPISKLRIINKNENLSLAFKTSKVRKKELSYTKFICKDHLVFKGYEDLLNTVKKYYNQATNLDNEQMIIKLQDLDINGYDAYDICHGHDLTRVIAIGMKKRIGKSKLSSVSIDEIERVMRLSYTLLDFNNTKMKAKLDEINAKLVKKYVA